MLYVVISAIVIIVIAIGVIMTRKRNNEIKRSGIETDAVVTRVREDVSTDEDGTTYTYTFYVAYQTQEGQTVEARLASGKSIDIRIGKNVWDRDLHEGSKVRIKYLPDKPDYVIRIDA